MYSVFFTLMPFCLSWIFGFFSWGVGLILVLWFSGWTAIVRQWEDSSMLFCWSSSLRKASYTDMCCTTCTWWEPHGDEAGALLESINRMGPAKWYFALVSQDTAALSAPSQSVLFAFHVDSKFLFLFFKVTWFTVESVQMSVWVRLRSEFHHSINYL